jgi:hypothetical protein
MLTWLPGLGVGSLEGGEMPIAFIKGAQQWETWVIHVRVEDGMAADNNEGINSCIGTRRRFFAIDILWMGPRMRWPRGIVSGYVVLKVVGYGCG